MTNTEKIVNILKWINLDTLNYMLGQVIKQSQVSPDQALNNIYAILSIQFEKEV